MTNEKDQPQSRDDWRKGFRSRLDEAAAKTLGVEDDGQTQQKQTPPKSGNEES